MLDLGAEQREKKPIHADHSVNSCELEVFVVLFLFLTALSGRKYQRNLTSVFQHLSVHWSLYNLLKLFMFPLTGTSP